MINQHIKYANVRIKDHVFVTVMKVWPLKMKLRHQNKGQCHISDINYIFSCDTQTFMQNLTFLTTTYTKLQTFLV
jgi:hypothetical protein